MMKHLAAATSLVSLIPGILSQAMTINTPSSMVQCQPTLITWSGGIAPYYLAALPGGQPSAQPIKTFDTQQAQSLTYIVDMAGGTKTTFSLKDSTGAVGYTDIVTVQPSSDSSCLSGGSTSNSASNNTGNSANAAAGSASPAIVTQATDATSSAAGSTSGTASSRAAGTSASAAATRAASTSAAAPATQSRAAGTTAPAATTSATTNTSGSKSSFSLGRFGLVGILGFVGALFL